MSSFFFDETGFNLPIGLTRSWSEVGNTPVVVVPTNKGKNISALVCISTSGVVSIVIKEGAFNSVDFKDFLDNLIRVHPSLVRGESTLVMDNAKNHHAVNVTNFLEEKNVRNMFLPPYSPELNPIELFGTVKASYRRDGPAQSKMELMGRIQETFQRVGEEVDMRRYYQHMRQYVVKAMNREHFFFPN